MSATSRTPPYCLQKAQQTETKKRNSRKAENVFSATEKERRKSGVVPSRNPYFFFSPQVVLRAMVGYGWKGISHSYSQWRYMRITFITAKYISC